MNAIQLNFIYSVFIMNLSQKKIFIEIAKKNIETFYKDNFDKKYRRKYSIEYYLDLIFELINDVNNWYSLSKLNTYKPIPKKNNEKPKYHWKTIQNLYNKWSNDNIFKLCFDNYINNKNVNVDDIDLYIDSSFINNKYGVENIGLNTDNKKKKGTKLSIISDDNKFIYSVSSIPINNVIKKRKYRKRRKHNKKRRKYIKKKTKNKLTNKTVNKINIKGFVHDVNTIENSINNINKKYKFKITLIGDKGYISSKEYKFKNKKIELITLKRNNQKKQTINFIKIKKRKIIENTIACIKKNERILTRKDHTIKNYMSWVYICCLIYNIKINMRDNQL